MFVVVADLILECPATTRYVPILDTPWNVPYKPRSVDLRYLLLSMTMLGATGLQALVGSGVGQLDACWRRLKGIDPSSGSSRTAFLLSSSQCTRAETRRPDRRRKVGRVDVEYPRFGEIVIAGVRFDHDVIVERGRTRRRKKGPSKAYRDQFGHTPLSADEEIPWSAQKLVIGTGADGRLPVMQEVRDLAEARGVELVELPTVEACRLLCSARRKEVNAILHVTC